MNKKEFITELQAKLSELPEKDAQDRILFYSEMIDDRMEEGLSEEEALREIGSPEDIAAQVIEETPIIKIVKDKIKPQKKMQAWEIVLLILGSPIWISLLISFFAVIFSVYVSIWATVISFWAIFISLIACSFSGLASGTAFLFGGHTLTGLLLISACFICAGLSIFTFFGCKKATKGMVLIPKYIVLKIKKRVMKKEKSA